jgi:acetylglutamate/LysW-gamma-L-alpha-aminoadipate kinase
MKRKVIGAQEALDGGVRRVVIGDGRIHGAVSAALGGAGTEFVR